MVAICPRRRERTPVRLFSFSYLSSFLCFSLPEKKRAEREESRCRVVLYLGPAVFLARLPCGARALVT